MHIDISSRFNYEQLFRFVLPSVVMMIFISTYTMVDGFFVSNYVGKTAFTAVNLIFPAIMVFACVGFMFGSGGSALVAKTMGEGQTEKANRLFSLIVLSAFAGGILLSALGYFLMPFLASAMGASGEVLACSVFYGHTLLLSLPMFVLQRVFQSFMVTAGKPSFGLCMTILSGVTNIGLDALFILVFKWGPLRRRPCHSALRIRRRSFPSDLLPKKKYIFSSAGETGMGWPCALEDLYKRLFGTAHKYFHVLRFHALQLSADLHRRNGRGRRLRRDYVCGILL